MTERPERVRRLGAVGTLVWDRIWYPTAEGPVEQWGGATYSFTSLSAASPPGWEVVPVIKIGQDVAARALDFLERLPNLALDRGVRVVPEANNQVELRYRDRSERWEIQRGGVPGWRWPELEPVVAGLDALYVNFLSGYELDLETAERLRAGFQGPVYADLHSLFLGPPGDRPREWRPLPDVERWLACFDAIQLNEKELSLLAGSDDPSDADLARVLDAGPRLVVVTLGGRGVRYLARAGLPDDPLCWRSAPDAGAGPLRRGLLPPPLGPVEGDPTGCGDVWGGAFFSGLLAGLPLEEAVVRAERFAAAKILHPDTSRLHLRLRGALAG